MNMCGSVVIMAGLSLGASGTARAYEFRCRFVERVGNLDVVLEDNTIDVSSGAPRNIRVQFGVFDDASGPAPAGGYIGWTRGQISVSVAPVLAEVRRNPGRLAPFNFATGPNANGNPPLPDGDPFELLTDIDNTIGNQAVAWRCAPDGTPLPQPQPVIRGRNTFVSTYAFQIDPADDWLGFTVTVSGNVYAASQWNTFGTLVPPDCGNPADPSDDIPGVISYVPVPTAPSLLSAQLTIPHPVSPGAAALFSIAGFAASRRRRSPDR